MGIELAAVVASRDISEQSARTAMNISRRVQLLLLVGAVLAGLQALTQAQTPYYGGARGARQPQRFGSMNRSVAQPTVSPYINLLRRGNSTALNYYGLVRPEQEFRAANEQFSENFGQVDRDIRRVRSETEMGSERTESGHRTSFMKDQQGGPGSVVETLKERDGKLRDLPQSSASRLPPTGHGSYFGNTGTYYPQQQR